MRPNHCHHVTDFDTLMNLIFFSKSYSSYISISQPGRSEKASDALLYIPFGMSRLSDSSCWHLYRSNNACASTAWNTADPFSSPLPSLLDLDMSCHRMDIAFHGIRRGLRTNFTLHSTALDTFRQRCIKRRRREREREIHIHYMYIDAREKPQHGLTNRRRDEGFAAGVGRGGGWRKAREGWVKRPHSLILVEAENVLPSLTTSLSPRACRGDGAILIPRCGFMNKISGLSDGGV